MTPRPACKIKVQRLFIHLTSSFDIMATQNPKLETQNILIMTNEEFAEFFKKKTKEWAIRVIKYLEKIPDSPTMRTVRFQLIKSATSTAANYRAACRGRSNAEFVSKISITLEEADESLFWLEMIEGCGIDKSAELTDLQKIASEIVSVLVRTRKNTEK